MFHYILLLIIKIIQRIIDMVEIHDGSTASFLDKTDWRKTIHRCLEECVRFEETMKYPQTVKSLVSAFSATYPGFDARALVDREIYRLQVKYRILVIKFVAKHPDYWFHPGKRMMVEPEMINSYYKEIFEFIKNLAAEKRMLLWGIKKIRGGTQMED